MQSEMSASARPIESHSTTARWLHWGFIVVFVYALTKQLDEVEELEDAALLIDEMVFASIFLVLLLGRFFYMRRKPTVLPVDTPKHMRRLARTVHLAMYTCLAMIAVTGLVIGALYGGGIKSGVSMELALIAHEIFVITTYWLIIGHVAAAIFHRRRNDGIWSSMVPLWKEDR